MHRHVPQPHYLSGNSPTNLASQLLKTRAEERLRLGQELHDSTGQLIVALQLSVARLRALHRNCGHDDLLSEIEEMMRRIDREIRALALL